MKDLKQIAKETESTFPLNDFCIGDLLLINREVLK